MLGSHIALFLVCFISRSLLLLLLLLHEQTHYTCTLFFGNKLKRQSDRDRRANERERSSDMSQQFVNFMLVASVFQTLDIERVKRFGQCLV
jgi:hypothetical protein